MPPERRSRLDASHVDPLEQVPGPGNGRFEGSVVDQTGPLIDHLPDWSHLPEPIV